MITESHMKGGGDHVRDVLAEQKSKEHYVSVKEAISFYMERPEYTEVYIVRCMKCGRDMCLEVLEPATRLRFLDTHHQGRRRITLGFEDAPDGYLLSHRKRLDGAMGYQCGAIVDNPKFDAREVEVDNHNQSEKLMVDSDPEYRPTFWVNDEPKTVRCGNDTIISNGEMGYTRVHPSGQTYVPAIEPHLEARLKAQLVREGHKPDIEVNGNITRIETFEVERLK